MTCAYAGCTLPGPTVEDGWAVIPGFPRYEVSDDGRVRSSCRSQTPRELVCSVASNGYPTVRLRAGVSRSVTVHSLVAAVFLGPRPEGQQVRHIDGDRTNNHVINLTYGSALENAADTRRHGTHGNTKKTACRAGHPYTPETTRIDSKDARECRICRAASKARYRDKMRGEAA